MENFNDSGSLEKVLQLLIIAYKDNSPRDFFTLSKDIESAQVKQYIRIIR